MARKSLRDSGVAALRMLGIGTANADCELNRLLPAFAVLRGVT